MAVRNPFKLLPVVLVFLVSAKTLYITKFLTMEPTVLAEVAKNKLEQWKLNNSCLQDTLVRPFQNLNDLRDLRLIASSIRLESAQPDQGTLSENLYTLPEKKYLI